MEKEKKIEKPIKCTGNNELVANLKRKFARVKSFLAEILLGKEEKSMCILDEWMAQHGKEINVLRKFLLEVAKNNLRCFLQLLKASDENISFEVFSATLEILK